MCKTGWKIERREMEVPAGHPLQMVSARSEKDVSCGGHGVLLLCWGKNTRVGIFEGEDLFYGLYFSIINVLHKHPFSSRRNALREENTDPVLH